MQLVQLVRDQKIFLASPLTELFGDIFMLTKHLATGSHYMVMHASLRHSQLFSKDCHEQSHGQPLDHSCDQKKGTIH